MRKRAASSTTYSSERMRQRRSDVLSATRALIARHGIDNFTVKMIADEAATTPTTVFNIWGGKEAIIRQAIVETFHANLFNERSDKPESVAELLAYIDWTWEQILALGPYVSSVASFFFGREDKGEIRKTLKAECDAPYLHYMKHVSQGGLLKPGTDISVIVDLITSQIFAYMHAWSIGEIDDARLRLTLHLAVLGNLHHVIEGELGREVRGLQDDQFTQLFVRRD
jgi:AcrR family transcriptional regulator